MDAHHGEKQQKALPLDTTDDVGKTEEAGKPAKVTRKSKAEPKPKADVKPVVIEAEMLDKAREFVVTNKNASIAGLQNRLSIGFNKANALLEALAAEGIVEFVGSDLEGGWEMVTAKSKKIDEAIDELAGERLKTIGEAPAISLDEMSKRYVDEAPTELTDDLMKKIRDKTVRDGEVYASGLIVSFDLSEDLATTAIERLELEGFISPEDDMGLRTIIGEAA
jgi:ribosomal protein S25